MSGAQTSSDSLINKTKPPAIVGEATVLWVEPKSATAVITYSRGPIFPGDEVGFAITDQALRKPNKPGKNVRQAAANNSRQMVAKR
jgi:hypothetical protein